MATHAAPPTRPPRPARRGVLRSLGWLLLALVVLLVLAASAITIWATRDGSLATALRLAGDRLPLAVQDARGAILGRGQIGHLAWDQDGLRVEVEQATLDWRPRELLQRRLHVVQLTAERIAISDQRAPSEPPPPSSGLPDSLALPFGLRIAVDRIEAGEIRWEGPPARTVRDVNARYHFNGEQHVLELQNVRYADDDYQATLQAQATAGAHAPMPLSVRASGAASARPPDAGAPVLAALQASVSGTLADMRAQLRLQAAPATAADAAPLQAPALPDATTRLQAEPNLDWPASGEASPLRLDLTARITPQDALPLQEASGELRALNLHALVPQAPETELAAQFSVTPVAASPAGAGAGWALQARVVNGQPGPWDAQHLPVDRLTATARWQDGVATVDDLLVELAGGRVQANGQWQGASGNDGPNGGLGSWQVTSRIEQINPARLYTGLAEFPIDGTVQAAGQDTSIEFDVALDAAGGAVRPDAGTHADDGRAADAVAAQLRALALQQVRASGRFADGLLALERLHVQTDDATLAGNARVQLADPQHPVVDTAIDLQAPGLKVTLQARELAADQGTGTVQVDLGDAAAALQWARRLPVVADALTGAQASGSAQLNASWQDGWLAPTLQARLTTPQLDITPPSENGSASPIQIRALDTTVQGRLEQAALQLQGRVLQPAHGVDLPLALDAEGGWSHSVLTLSRLQLKAGDASAAGHARLDLSDAFQAEADLQLRAPGLASTIRGTLAPDSGDGTLRLDLSDAAATLRWARTLPGAADALAGAQASGTAQLSADWQGGLDHPRVNATLAVPTLDYRPGADASAITVRDLQARLAGDLAQAALTASGRVVQGDRQVDLRLAADGGRSSSNAAAWRLRISELAAQLQLPELGEGQWQIASQNDVPIGWNPANGGQLDVAAGELTITSPAPRSQSRIIWEPLRWRDGQLNSAGRITELPLAWAQRVAKEQLEDAGISGDIVLGGQWDIQMGQRLKLDARLERISGDLNISASPQSGGEAGTVPAGLRQARAELSSNGSDVSLALTWDSARAGVVDGQFRTRLAAKRGTDGQTRWTWSNQAPLQGHLKATLPEISVWSLLAPPGWRLHGSLGADVQVSGSAAQPQVAGTLSADDLALRSVVDGLQFEDGRLRAHMQGTRVIVDEFILHGAGEDGSGGSIRVTGEAGLLDGKPAAQIRAVIDKLHASVRDDRELIASGNVDAAFRDQTVSAKGMLTVDRARIVLPDESRPSLGGDVFIHGLDKEDHAALEASKAPTPDDAGTAETDAQAGADAGDSPLRANVDIKIDLGEDFQVQGMGIDTRLAGTLALTANGPLAGMPTLNGRVETVGGTFRAYGQFLDITRGRIFFSGDASNPGLDILALRPNYTSDQKVGALIQGTALLPQVRLYSEPTLPDDQVLAWLILGHAAPADGGEAALMQTAALALLGGRDSGGLASSFGLDQLSFGGGSGEGLSGTSVTLGKRLSDRLYTAYEHSLSGTGGVLMIFYELSRRWVLRGQASQSSAVDLIYSLSYD